MASPQRLPPVTFTPTRTQRGARLIAGIACVTSGTGILILVFAGRAGAGKAAAGLIIAGVGLGALGTWFLAARHAHTTIDADGVHTSSMFRRRSCHWSDVTDIDADIDAAGGDPMVWSIKIHRRGGRPFTLTAPTDSSRKGRHDNRDFTSQLATIRSYWQASTSQPQSRQP